MRHEPLISALVTPDTLAGLDLSQWDLLIRQARHAELLAQVAALVAQRDLWSAIPPVAWPHLKAAATLGKADGRTITWELGRIERALAGVTFPVVLLKGAAYVALETPFARGRASSDVDILVPKSHLPQAESLLLEHGWEPTDLSEYHQRYFRDWMHELPPLQHRDRATLIDVHHAILPPTDTLSVDPNNLIAAARPLEGSPFLTLAPADMALHCASHLFRNGNFRKGLRDLFDLDGIFRHFGAEAGFWEQFVARVREFGLFSPCYFGVHYAQSLFQTPIPPEAKSEIERWRPNLATCALIRRLVDAALMPSQLDDPDRRRDLAVGLLSFWPLPCLAAMTSPLFWIKRFAPAHREA